MSLTVTNEFALHTASRARSKGCYSKLSRGETIIIIIIDKKNLTV